MFCILFGWRRASKCKKLIKQLQYRLKLLKNKKSSIVRFIREDMAQLIQNSDEEKAFQLGTFYWQSRAEQLFKEESRMAVYEMLDNFCEFIRSNLSYIRKNKDCPNDINEAVSTLIYASSRCGDLPELCKIRKLFEERYGRRFALASAELFSGNLVNCQVVRYSLRITAANLGFWPLNILLICYRWKENESSDANKIHDLQVDSELTRETKSTGLNQSHSHRNSDANGTSLSSSIVQKSSPDMFELPEHKNAGKVGDFAQFDSPFEFRVAVDLGKQTHSSGRISADTKEHREERIIAASSSESLSEFDEEKVVYLDDIEELQTSTPKDGDWQDQRLFKFKPSVQPKTKTVDQYDTWSENSSSRSSRKSEKTARKQSRRRSFFLENSNIKDTECKAYYDKPRKSSSSKHRSHHRREHQRKTSVEESTRSCYGQEGLKQAFCKDVGRKFQSFNYNNYDQMKLGHCHLNCERDDCSLEHSSYFCIGDDKEWEIPRSKLQTGTRKPVKVAIYDLKSANFGDHLGQCHFSHHRKSEEIERPALHQKSRRTTSDNGATEYNIFTYHQDRWQNEQVQNTKAKA
ncbi:hypothetical protein Patl1_02217 [Pistacia atlantica]|uniref:Uncharacterized protein n=1 Tax=Pistacia atlantica TaxID=434234 RepID=A0ACC1CAK6_9ROSI|nr:hypothetical protein Patl1_02217 [Pistacia atlantica]